VREWCVRVKNINKSGLLSLQFNEAGGRRKNGASGYVDLIELSHPLFTDIRQAGMGEGETGGCDLEEA